MPLDKVVDKIVALGAPGIVLLVAMSYSGYVGGAAIMTALATLGGPLGMLGGIGLLAVLVLISKALSVYGFEAIMKAILTKHHENGLTKQEIQEKITKYWFISKELKNKLLTHLQDLWPPEA